METIVIVVLVAILAVVVGYWMGKRESGELRKANAELSNGKTLAEANARALQRQMAEQKEEHAKRLQELKQDAEKNAKEQKEQLTETFKNLSNELLNSQSKSFSEKSSETIDTLTAPLKEQLRQMKQELEEYRNKDSEARGKLKSDFDNVVRQIKEQCEQIGNDANNLASALKSEAKTQGNWGEMVLENILESSGLEKGRQYKTQLMLRDEQGKVLTREEDGKQVKMVPDAVVMMPNDKKLVIDSKVSLTAYTDAMNAPDEETAKGRLAAHVKSVRAHVDELAKKNYDQYVEGSPDFVVMFMPIEHAYYEAMRTDGNLWNYAYQKGVLMVNPTNLVTLIRLVLDLWVRNAREQNYDDAIASITKMYEKYAHFTESMSNVGKQLGKAQDAYDEAYKQLSTGKDNLGRQMERLKDKYKMVNSNKELAMKAEE